MHARAGAFPGGVQPFKSGASARIHQNAAAKVVGRRHHGNGRSAHVEALLLAFAEDGGEALGHVVVHAAGGVQVHAVVAGAQQFGHNGPGHYVARGQVCALVVALHEGLAGGVHQPRPFAAHRLGDEETALEAARALVERRGVELHVLQVVQLGPGAVRHGKAGADGLARVGAVQKDAPGPARGQHRKVRQNDLNLIQGLVEHIRAHALVGQIVLEIQVAGVVMRGQKVDGRALGEHADVRAVAHGLGQLLHYGQAGVVFGVKDARHAMAALPREVPGIQVAVCKGHVVGVDECFLQDFRAFVAQVAHGPQVVLPPARVQNVLFQNARVVALGVEDDAALGQAGVAGEQVLARGEEDHVRAGLGQVEGGQGPGDAGADDQNVGFEAIVVHGDPLAGPWSACAGRASRSRCRASA